MAKATTNNSERAAERAGDGTAISLKTPLFGSRSDHLPYAAAAFIVGIALFAWRLTMSRSFFEDTGQWIFGVIAAALLALTLIFSVKRHGFKISLGALRPFYLLHLWAGGLWGPIALLHADGKARGPFFIALALLAVLSWLSGLAGAVFQNLTLRLGRQEKTETVLLEDSLASRERLRCEIEELLEERSATFTGMVREGLKRFSPTLKSLLRTVFFPEAPSQSFEAVRAYMEKQDAASSAEEAAAMDRIARDLADIRIVEARIFAHRVREGWLTFHTAVSAPAAVLLCIHIVAILRY